MATMIGIYLPESEQTYLRDTAKALAVPISTLASLLMRLGQERATPEQLQSWAESLAIKPVKRRRGLTMNEQAALDGFKRLLVKGEGAWKFSGQDIAASSGLRYRDAHFAMCKLQSRGLARGFEVPEEHGGGFDRWERPKKVMWTLLDDKGADVKSA